jgi:hypothetical protein
LNDSFKKNIAHVSGVCVINSMKNVSCEWKMGVEGHVFSESELVSGEKGFSKKKLHDY